MATVNDIIALVKVQLSTSAEIINDPGYESAVASALSELGWILPNDSGDKIVWIAKRALRNCIFILWVASAQKFKYKQVNLQQRFDHYDRILKIMDAEYETALLSQTNIFSGVAAYKQFGTAIGPGFTYDSIGRDTTYDIAPYLNTGE